MTPLQSRLTLMVDEWGGILLCVYLWRIVRSGIDLSGNPV